MSSFREIDGNLLYLETSGSFEEIGQGYGQALATKIHERVNITVEALKKRFGESQLQRSLVKLQSSFKKSFPYLWKEIGGVCLGSGVTLESLTAHLYAPGIGDFLDKDDGCSDIIFPRSDVGPLLGKTHDATSPEPGLMVVRLIGCDSKNDVLCVTRVDGFSTATGLNEKGLAIGEASIHFHTKNEAGTVRNLLLRPALHECASVEEAVTFLEEHAPISAGFHFALVDASGSAAIVERSPTQQNVRWSKGEAVFCTNHTATPFMRELEKSRGREGDRNSDTRYVNLKRLIGNGNCSFSFQSLKDIMRFHHKDGGICQHGDPDYQGEKLPFYPLFTQRAFVNVVKHRRLLVANGNPCVNEFHEFCLKT